MSDARRLPETAQQWAMLQQLRNAPFGYLDTEEWKPWRLAVAVALENRGLGSYAGCCPVTGEWDERFHISGWGGVAAPPALKEPDPECRCCHGGGICHVPVMREDGGIGSAPGEQICECRWIIPGAA